jgi:1,2-diacylglycerol 3-alpha-glucosyltransferase
LTDFPKFVVHWPRFGPYHLARAEAAWRLLRSRGIELIGLEIAGQDDTYPWRSEVSTRTPFPRRTLFPNGVYEQLKPSTLRRAVSHFLKTLHPAAVAICGYSAPDATACLNWCRRREVPAILMTETTRHDKRRWWYSEAYKRWRIRRYKAALCGGRLHRDYLVHLGVPDSSIFGKYDVVDNEFFWNAAETARKTAARPDLPGLSSSKPYFLASNRLVPRKNLKMLVSAYACYRLSEPDGWPLVLLGSGPEEAGLRHLVEEQGIPDVIFAGFRQVEELPAYYAFAGCFVHPALTEPWGLVVNEALASGLPVLVSRTAGCAPDLVREGQNGFRFDPQDPEALAGALRAMARNPAKRWDMSRASRRLIGNWTVEDFAANLSAAFDHARSEFRLVHYGRRKVFAYGERSRQEKQRSLACYAAYTRRRHAVQLAAQALVTTGMDQILLPSFHLRTGGIIPRGLEKALDLVRTDLREPEGRPFFVWPAQPERQRLYVYLFGRKTNYFVKVSPGRDEGILREREMLAKLAAIEHSRFRFPKVCVLEQAEGLCCLVTEAIRAEELTAHRRDRLSENDALAAISAYSGSRRDFQIAESGDLFWCHLLQQRRKGGGGAFHSALAQDLAEPFAVQRVHGDLTRANLIIAREQVWILDWELSCEQGPVLTDVITFFLSQRQRRMQTRPRSVYDEFRDRFVSERSGGEQRDARLAVAYLWAMGSGLAQPLVQHWEE